MELSKILVGKSQLKVTKIIQGFGSLVHEENMDSGKLSEYVECCISEGITTFDLAAVYSGGRAESLLGEVFYSRPDLRDAVTILTKYGIEGRGIGYHCYNTSKESIINSAERSLKRMHIDHIDLFMMHRPDMLMDADEVSEALTRLKDDGKVRYFGVSNFLPHQLDLLSSRLSFPLIANEVPYSLFDMTYYENGVLDQCQQHHITPLYYAPLGGGRLFAPRNQDDLRLLTVLKEISCELGDIPIEQIALAWVLKHPAKGAALIGCGRIEWMKNTVGGAFLDLSRDHWFRLYTAAKGHEIP
ncbi:MAG: aldo/keto reductase [Oscillospiraceae bacterium]|nr:aldo/keto reductase [Oscillospiraceae bacterium]